MIFHLGRENIFPPVYLAEENGILAVGGDLSTSRLLEAYRNGIFPWYSEREPIIWWSPDPRFVLFPNELIISKSMSKILRKNTFHITYDKCFRDVIEACRNANRKDAGTWISNEMITAYIKLHEQGFAHSVEAWKEGALAGGLYGVSLGRFFFGESMFTRTSNASKAAFITLTQKLGELNYIIDCQVYTDHMESLGARMILRTEFISLLNEWPQYKTLVGDWGKKLFLKS